MGEDFLMKKLSTNISETIETFGPGQMGITTGFDSLDQCIRGFLPGKVVVIAARSGCGKSSIMLDMGLAASKEAPVTIFSIEMPFDLIQTRSLANLTQLNHEAMVKDQILPIEKQEVQAMKKQIEALPIVVDDSPCHMYPATWEKWNKIPEDSFNVLLPKAVDSGSKIVFIDYLQLIRMAGKYDRDDQRLHEITWLLHEKAKQYNITIVVLSQLKRFDAERYKGGNPRPRLDDLFGSSTTENDVDVALLLHRPSYYEQKVTIDLFENKIEEDAEIIIAKNRNGTTGVIPVEFHGYCMSYKDSSIGF